MLKLREKIAILFAEHRNIQRGFLWGAWPRHLEAEISRFEIQLSNHFSREEDVLTELRHELKNAQLRGEWNHLQNDHRQILSSIYDLKADASQASSLLSSRKEWGQRASGLRMHIIDTRVLLENHIEAEERFLIACQKLLEEVQIFVV